MSKDDPNEQCLNKTRDHPELLDLLCCVAQEVSYRRSPTFLLNHVFNRVAHVMRVEAASLFLLNEETGLLDSTVVKGLNAQALRELNFQLKPSEGLAGWVFTHNQAVIVNNPKEDPRFQPGADLLTGFNTSNLLAVPLRLNGRPVGVLEFVNRQKKDLFTDEDAALAESIACLLSTTVDNLRVVGALERSLATLRSFLEHVGEALVAVDRWGIVTHVSTRASNLFGWPLPPVGRPAAEALAASPEAEQMVTQVLREEKSSIRSRLCFAPTGSDKREFDVFVFPLAAPGQAVVGSAVIFSEVG
jgi:transcriptional regulator with GAF, ATPase, and Fis domain